MERTQIYLTKSQIKKLQEVANKKATTLSRMVREAIDVQYGARIPTKQAKRQETFAEAAERIAKLGEKGPRDLSSRVDEYLYGNL